MGYVTAADLPNVLSLPLIAAPMFSISGPDLVIAAGRERIIGAFPTANARTVDELDNWLTLINRGLSNGPAGPLFAVNLIINQERMEDDLACILQHRVPIVITSVGSPAKVCRPLQGAGALVFADVATLQHARKAADAGVDGLVLLTAGAGGLTGHLNPFSFVRAVRSFFNGLIVLAGGVSDGVSLHAARVLGCDLAYMGTKFIATEESLASPAYKSLLVDSTLDDVVLTDRFTGINGSFLRQTIEAAGLDLKQLEPPVDARARNFDGNSVKRWKDIWSAGHSVSGVTSVASVASVVRQTSAEYSASVAEANAVSTGYRRSM